MLRCRPTGDITRCGWSGSGLTWILAMSNSRLELVNDGAAIEIDAFPSVKASTYTVFHKFYVDPSRAPSLSDAFDIIISAATPYADVVFTENHQAEVLRKTRRLDQLLDDLEIYTLRHLRQFPDPGSGPDPSRGAD